MPYPYFSKVQEVFLNKKKVVAEKCSHERKVRKYWVNESLGTVAVMLLWVMLRSIVVISQAFIS